MKYLFAAAVFAALASPASAGPLLSGDGTETCNGGACVTIAPHPAWQPAGAAQWVSYADTGAGGIIAPSTTAAPLFTISEAFQVAYRSMLTLTVFADDTAQVFLNGTALNVPNFTQGICAIGPLGCEPAEGGEFAVEVAAGSNLLEIEVYQVGAVTTGAMYEGEVNAIPLPASGALAMAVIAGLALVSRRNKHEQ